MATFLVYRLTSSDKNRIHHDIGGFIVNAADAPTAIANAQSLASRICSPMCGTLVGSWSTSQLSTSDNATVLANNTVLQGEVQFPGSRLRGGGVIV